MADDNQDVDPKPAPDPKGADHREGVVTPKPLSATPPEEGGGQPDVGSKSDRAGKVKPGDKG